MLGRSRGDARAGRHRALARRVRIALWASERAREPRWDWLKWLPHHQDLDSRDAAGTRRLVAGTLAETELLLGGPSFNGRPRFEPGTPVTASEPFVVLVVDGVDIPADHRVADEGYRNAVVLDVSGACPGRSVPDALFLEVGRSRPAPSPSTGWASRSPPPCARPDRSARSRRAALARTMAQYRVGEVSDDEEPMAADYDLAGLLGLGDVAELRPGPLPPGADDAQRRLRVPIGIAGSGAPLELDIKESAEDGMGPHGLCVGATGSGKSELLRTLVLALAATHSSEELNFVLVDFKGGAAFLGFDQLPHTSAVITNLADELELVDRMQDALTGELNRRQEHLRAAGQLRVPPRLRGRACPGRAAGADARAVHRGRRVQRDAVQQARVHRRLRHDRPARPQPRRAPAAGRHSGSTRAASTRSRPTCPTASACAPSPPWRAAASSACPDAYELPNSPGNGYLRPDTQTLAPVQGRVLLGSRTARSVVPRLGTEVDQHVVAVQHASTSNAAAAPEPGSRGAGARCRTRTPATMLDVLIERLRGVGPRAHQVWLPPLKQSADARPAAAAAGGPPRTRPAPGRRPAGAHPDRAGRPDRPARAAATRAAGRGPVRQQGQRRRSSVDRRAARAPCCAH